MNSAETYLLLLLVHVLETFFTPVTLKLLPALAPEVDPALLEGDMPLLEEELAAPSEPFTSTSSPTCLLSFESSPCSWYVVPASSVSE